ncbi:hypothetical protein ACFDR9_005296 [Janthinobacterium sp. CG_23.3]|uniref:hypothetical protein n=1 Tax=Janthinobacterium sp. CG_23.3 TaxID=3349634 RepID=UPI0038D3F66B
MIREKDRPNKTTTHCAANERERYPRPQPARSMDVWLRILTTVMTFFLGLAVLMDSAALIGIA